MDSDYYTSGEKEFLLKVARQTLERFLGTGEKFEPQTVNRKLWESRGVFITLSHDDRLLGCMGNVEPIESLILAIRDNVIMAITGDSRFELAGAFDRVEIEISILSELKKNNVKNIKTGVGVLIKRGDNSATYLPSVWSSFRKKEHFLSSLCEKAGIVVDSLSDPETELWTYSTISFRK